ncbi:hypothetical protein [Methanimicrococcus hongohii]|uniref:hypothetical protein n=1 Tax=Methanimicrococcus hongohii TaxID=3028295 RepID=UPI00292D2F0F|nr:hypothetical protein [Methanimicrococcus sp. Hf6]
MADSSHTKRKYKNNQIYFSCVRLRQIVFLQLSLTVAGSGKPANLRLSFMIVAAARETFHLFNKFSNLFLVFVLFLMKPKHPIFKIGKPERPVKP